MEFFNAMVRAIRLLAEEFFSVLIIGIVGAVAMLPVVTMPLVLGGYAAMMDDLAEQRPVNLGRWWQGARAMWRPAYIWGILNAVVWALLLVALNFYGATASVGRALQGAVLVIIYLWYTVNLYYLPIARLTPDADWRATLQRATLTLFARPVDTLFLMIILGMVALPLYLTHPVLMLFHPLFAILFATVLVRLHFGLSAAIETEDLADEAVPRRAPRR